LDLLEPEMTPLDPPSRKPHIEPNMEWIGLPVAEIWPFEIFEMRGRSSVGQSSIYILTLIAYTPLRYVRNVAHEE